MKKQIFAAVLLATLAIAGVYAYLAFTANGIPTDNASNGAFRDGADLGTQDAKGNEYPHLALARWSTDSDRNAFTEGYKVAYEKTRSIVEQRENSLQTGSAAYCDGLYLGKLDAAQGRDAHVTIGRWAQAQDKESFAAGYRHAYLKKMAELVMRNHSTQQAMLAREARN